jgi:hypothetical protein
MLEKLTARDVLDQRDNTAMVYLKDRWEGMKDHNS